jgi:hypothetical protein
LDRGEDCDCGVDADEENGVVSSTGMTMLSALSG